MMEEIENKISIKLIPLGGTIDTYLIELLKVLFEDLSKPYEKFFSDNQKNLEVQIFQYFDGKINDPPGQDFLFNDLSIIWKFYQFNGRVGEAQKFWQDILQIVYEWEKSRGKRIHKGSIYYFWSQTAILQGELDKGFFLIHSAYEEDILTHGDPFPNTPAFKTVSLDYSDPNNLLYDLVTKWAIFLEDRISRYRDLSGRGFTLDIFRAKFLNLPPNIDVLFSFTYTLAKLYYFFLLPSFILTGRFTSIFELNYLYDLVLVVSAVIYSSLVNPSANDWTFKNLANHVLQKSGLSPDERINNSHFREIDSKKDLDFNKTVNDLLDQTFTYTDGKMPSRLECDLGIAYCLRNYTAHNIGSFSIIRERFSDVYQAVFDTLFFAIELK